MQRKKYNISKKQLQQLYVTEKKTMQEIADLIGCCKGTICNYLHNYNIVSRIGHPPKGIKMPTWKVIPKAELYDFYVSQELTMQEISEQYNCCRSQVFKLLKKYKIVTRTRAERNKKYLRNLSLSSGGTGIPYENTEYGAEFDSALKEKIRFKDKYKCKICGCTQVENSRQLDIHHIDYDKKNNSLMNLIALCISCHMKTNYNRKYWRQYFYSTY